MASEESSYSVTITECETFLSHEKCEKHPDPLSSLKDLEEMITSFKTKALLLEDEKESLLSSLVNFTDDFVIQSELESCAGERSEMVGIIDTLTNMLKDVDLKVTTKRNNHEEEALHYVNSIIDKLVLKVQDHGHNTKYLCYEFMKSCYRFGDCTEEMTTEASEEGDLSILFKTTVSKCTSDDKHRIGRRLYGLLNYIESQQKSIYSHMTPSSSD